MKNFNEYNKLNEAYSQGWTVGTDAKIIPKSKWKDTKVPPNLLYANEIGRKKGDKNTGVIEYNVNPARKKDFLKKFTWICNELGLNPNYMMAIMHLETSGTFSSKIKNFQTKEAKGLIQFTDGPAARETFGLNDADDIPTDPIRQLDYVYYYLYRWTKLRKFQPKTLADHYIGLVFLPGLANKPNNYDVSAHYKHNENMFAFYPKDHPKHKTLENLRLTVESGSKNAFRKALGIKTRKPSETDIASAKDRVISKDNFFDKVRTKKQTNIIAKKEAKKPVDVKSIYKSIEDLGKAIAKNSTKLTYA